MLLICTGWPVRGAWMICPLPTYIATWWMVPGVDPQNTRSPGRSWPTLIDVLCWNWATDQCGSDFPPARQAIMVSPEQSNDAGPSAAHRYGLPSWARA